MREPGLDVEREIADGNVEIAFPIAATSDYVSAVDSRDHVAVVASLRPFFQPRAVAVVGASARRGTIGGELFRNVLAGEFAGAAYPVNRNAEPVGGVRSYASIAEIPDEIDLAVLCLPGEHVLAAAEEALRAGVRALCVISAGFAELGAEGRARQEQLLSLVRAHGARLLGPNCLGIASDAARLNATFAAKPIPSGNIGFSSQSGALGLALLEAAAGRDLGLSAFVSIGNKADVSSNDLLEWWEEDDATDLVLLYLESFGNPRKFARLARRVARRKPILALKSGTTHAGRRAASSHTAALAGSDAAVDALFHQAGVIRAETLEELLDVAALLSSQPLPRGRRVGLLTNAGGLGILCADACEAAGLELPSLSPETEVALREVLAAEASVANPVDMLGGATPETFERVLPILLADNRVDAAIVLFVPPVSAGGDDVAAALERALAAAPTDKPVLAALMGADARTPSIARFDYPESAARALARAAERAEWLRRPLGADARARRHRRAPRASASSTRRPKAGSSLPTSARCSKRSAFRSSRSASPRPSTKPPPLLQRSASPWWSRPQLQACTRRRPAASRSACATSTRFARPRSGSGCRSSCSRWRRASSCSRASSRIRCSARSSPSAQAACRPS